CGLGIRKPGAGPEEREIVDREALHVESVDRIDRERRAAFDPDDRLAPDADADLGGVLLWGAGEGERQRPVGGTGDRYLTLDVEDAPDADVDAVNFEREGVAGEERRGPAGRQAEVGQIAARGVDLERDVARHAEPVEADQFHLAGRVEPVLPVAATLLEGHA